MGCTHLPLAPDHALRASALRHPLSYFGFRASVTRRLRGRMVL